MKQEGFLETMTPIMNSSELYKTSGHWEHFQDDTFHVKIENQIYALKPMNCPNAITMYKMDSHSYRDLPIRYSDKDVLFRNEQTGNLNGLFRARQFSQDDAHIFCTDAQIEEEVSRNLKLCDRIYKVFGLKPKFYLATRPDKAMGSKKIWDVAEKRLAGALKKNKLEYGLKEKDGAFYGPKIDLHMEDSLGREWQIGTIQLDFNQPERFELEYMDEKGEKQRPAIVHRVVLGSFERFIGILVEHYSGAFPLWLAPVQVKLLNFTDRNLNYAKKIEAQLVSAGLRVEADYRNETVPAKVRDGELEKVNYVLVVGDKEEQAGTVAVRKRGEGKPKFGVKTNDFLKQIMDELERKV